MERTTVNLRIEADNGTSFDYMVTIEYGLTHKCQGNNGNLGSTPDPTVTDALDTASKLHGFTCDYTFYESYKSCLITRIGGTSQNNGKYWWIYINGQRIQKGACQQKIEKDDKLLFKLDDFKENC